MKIFSFLIVGALLMNAVGCKNQEKVEDGGKLRHLVLFKFNEDASDDQVKSIEDAFRNLPAKIPEIIDFEWGKNISSEGKSQDFTHCFLVTFKNEEGRGVYLPHQEHKAFVELLQPYIEKVLVVDYNPEKDIIAEQSYNTKGKLRHVVLFKWKEDAGTEQILTNEKAFSSLPDKISTIKAFEWGHDCGVEGLSDGFTHCYLLTFDNNEGIETYSPHPAHKEFGDVIRSSKDKVLVFDYIAIK